MGITLITQVALVPLYLSYWEVKTYGLWLAILSLSGLLSALDLGFQEYLGYEFLRIGKNKPRLLSKHLCSGLLMGVLLGIVQMAIMAGILLSGLIQLFLNGLNHPQNEALLFDSGCVLLMQGAAWLLSTSMGGILTRSLSVFGYYPRMAWWGVFSAFLLNFSPAIVVVMGAGLLQTGITVALVRILADVPIFMDMRRLLRREKITFSRPSLVLGWILFKQSVLLSVSSILENLRQQGARLLVTPFVGTAGLAAFSTMRTGTNVAIQGLHTVTNPLMPELMRFLHTRDQQRCEMAFGTVWVITIAMLTPALICLQAFVAPLYTTWTRGQIPFDPWLFAILSLSVLSYAAAQPAMAVVRGNNLLTPQLTISAGCAALVLLGISLLVPWIGISGAGISLLLAELMANIAYGKIAKKWLYQNGLVWPKQAAALTTAAIGIAAVAMTTMILFPPYKWVLLIASLIACYWNIRRFLMTMPQRAKQITADQFSHIPLIKHLFPK